MISVVPPTQIYRINENLGYGAFSVVYKAEEVNSGRQVALKKSRVSQRVKRPILRYESRVLQLIQGHPAIPAIYGYGHLPHFEYMALELLGSSIGSRTEGPVSVTTAVRVVLQMLSALEHIHNHGFIHRDIKPENLLCSSTDPSKVVVVDFGIARPITPGPPSKGDSQCVIGTRDWASLNAHNGISLGPRDDLESLAYVAFFLIRGTLPWKISGQRDESYEARVRRVHASKAAIFGAKLGAGFPAEFAYLLDYSRSLGYDQIPDYADLKTRFTDLSIRIGIKDFEGPLDWSVVSVLVSHDDSIPEIAPDGDVLESEDDAQNDAHSKEENFSDSWFDWYCYEWDIQGARSRNLTLPVEQAKLADSNIPHIVEVSINYN